MSAFKMNGFCQNGHVGHRVNSKCGLTRQVEGKKRQHLTPLELIFYQKQGVRINIGDSRENDPLF